MNFLDELENDLNNTFMNAEEFATTHEFDGKSIICVVDDDALTQNKMKHSEGTYKGVKVIHVSSSQLEGKPAVDGRFTFDGEYYYVSDCKENCGMYTITLSKNKSE